MAMPSGRRQLRTGSGSQSQGGRGTSKQTPPWFVIMMGTKNASGKLRRSNRSGCQISLAFLPTRAKKSIKS